MAAAAPRTPLRPLGTAEILDGAVRAVRRNANAAFALAVPFAIVRAAGFAAFVIASSHWGDATLLQLLARAVLSALFGTILTGLLAPVFRADLLGGHLDSAAAWQQSRGSAFALVIVALIVAIGEQGGLVLALLAGAWVWGVWAVAAPALVLERTGVRGALGRSVQLVRSEFWRVLGIRALRWVLTSVVGLLITLPFSLLAVAVTGTDLGKLSTLGIADPNLYVVIVSIGTLLAVTVTSPVSAAVDALIYADLRMRREGMDLVLALGPESPPTDRPAVSAW